MAEGHVNAAIPLGWLYCSVLVHTGLVNAHVGLLGGSPDPSQSILVHTGRAKAAQTGGDVVLVRAGLSRVAPRCRASPQRRRWSGRGRSGRQSPGGEALGCTGSDWGTQGFRGLYGVSVLPYGSPRCPMSPR
uniref:Uncharacterized protein n=1 Tax=Columba livia TaxID=8932 RepID=R7VW18_COLLI